VSVNISGGQAAQAYTDTNNPPTTIVGTFSPSSGIGAITYMLTFVVVPGNFYRVVSGGTIAQWIEWY
jgi:hypothetical protein